LIKLKGIKTVLTVASGLSIFYPPSMGITHKVDLITSIFLSRPIKYWILKVRIFHESLMKPTRSLQMV